MELLKCDRFNIERLGNGYLKIIDNPNLTNLYIIDKLNNNIKIYDEKNFSLKGVI